MLSDYRIFFSMGRDILGFDAQLYKTQHKVNGDRRFVINYYMADNTLKIYEKGHPNTGYCYFSFCHVFISYIEKNT